MTEDGLSNQTLILECGPSCRLTFLKGPEAEGNNSSSISRSLHWVKPSAAMIRQCQRLMRVSRFVQNKEEYLSN